MSLRLHGDEEVRAGLPILKSTHARTTSPHWRQIQKDRSRSRLKGSKHEVQFGTPRSSRSSTRAR